MLLKKIASHLIAGAEKRVGVKFDYIHEIAQSDLSLLARYNKIFGFLDPNKKAPPLAYHAARLRGAIAADCGTCVEAEINLARQAGIDVAVINSILGANQSGLSEPILAVVRLSDAVVGSREDDPDARDVIRRAYGAAGLIEICYAMNGAALLPGVKRAMGHATRCDLSVLQLKNNNSKGT